MSSDPDVPALQRFGRDLRRIREDRDVTTATVHTHTQVPESQIQSFEAGTLYEESTMTPVYLRAFVRAYAEAVDLPPHAVLDQLESALSGNYQNQLAVQYLDVPPSASEPDSSTEQPDAPSREDEQEIAPRGSPTGEEADSGEAAQSAVPERESGEMEGESETPDPDPEDETVSTASTAGGNAPVEQSGGREGGVLSQLSSGSRERPSAKSGGTLWSENQGASLVAIAGLFLIAAAGALTSIYRGEPERAPNSPSGSSAAVAPADQPSPDSLTAADTAPSDERPQQNPPSDVAPGDTLHMTVHATADVRELRIRQDDDLRRPYWIREGEAVVFPFTRRITLENQLDSVRLLVERYPYPVSQTDDEGRIVLTRDRAQRFFDTLRASPSTVPGSPDTIRAGVPGSEADSP